MKKETFADKLARKAFESDKIQKSWQMHIQAFGPILKPAFVDNYQARIHLTSALNYISNRKIKEGLDKLQSIEKYCSTNSDRAALLFCMGVCFEMADMKDEMLGCYQGASEYGHSFYLPYLKVAKNAHNDAVLDIAEGNYLKAINCLKSNEPDEHTKTILGSVYTNYASCLTMMHRYEEAEQFLNLSKETLPEQKGRTATEAILEAAKGNNEKARSLMDLIAGQEPNLYDATAKVVNDISEKTHPHFYPVKLTEGWTNAFWDWFTANEKCFLELLEAEDYVAVFKMVQPKLKEALPFAEHDLEFGIQPKDGVYQVIFADFFMVSLDCAYKELIKCAPPSLAEHWIFDTAR